EVTAEVLRLDDYLPPLKNLSLVKADTEGAELMVFRGGEKVIRQHLPTVICEINPWYLEGFGIRLSDLTGFFFDMGYRLYFYEKGYLREVPVDQVVEDNYVFVHPSREDRLARLFRRS